MIRVGTYLVHVGACSERERVRILDGMGMDAHSISQQAQAVPEAGASGAPAVAAAMRWEQRDCDCSQRRLRGVTEEDKRAMEGWRTPRGYMTRWVDGHDLLVKGDVNCPIYGDAVVQEQATQSYSRGCSICPVFECCFCHVKITGREEDPCETNPLCEICFLPICIEPFLGLCWALCCFFSCFVSCFSSSL